MVQYYNLTKLSDSEGYITFLKNMSILSGSWLGVGVELLIFIIPLLVFIKNGEDYINAFMASSLFTVIAGIIFYISGIIPNSLCIYIPALIFGVSVASKWMIK